MYRLTLTNCWNYLHICIRRLQHNDVDVAQEAHQGNRNSSLSKANSIRKEDASARIIFCFLAEDLSDNCVKGSQLVIMQA